MMVECGGFPYQVRSQVAFSAVNVVKYVFAFSEDGERMGDYMPNGSYDVCSSSYGGMGAREGFIPTDSSWVH